MAVHEPARMARIIHLCRVNISLPPRLSARQFQRSSAGGPPRLAPVPAVFLREAGYLQLDEHALGARNQAIWRVTEQGLLRHHIGRIMHAGFAR
jgi:hypothetical protein